MAANTLSERDRGAVAALIGLPLEELERLPLAQARAVITEVLPSTRKEERDQLRDALRYLESLAPTAPGAAPVPPPMPTPRERMLAEKARLLDEARVADRHLGEQMELVRESIQRGTNLLDGLRRDLEGLMQRAGEVHAALRTTTVRVPRPGSIAARLDSQLGGIVAHFDSGISAADDRIHQLQANAVETLLARRKYAEAVADYDGELLRAIGVNVERDTQAHAACFDEVTAPSRRTSSIEPALIGEGNRVIRRGKIFRAPPASVERDAAPAVPQPDLVVAEVTANEVAVPAVPVDKDRPTDLSSAGPGWLSRAIDEGLKAFGLGAADPPPRHSSHEDAAPPSAARARPDRKK